VTGKGIAAIHQQLLCMTFSANPLREMIHLSASTAGISFLRGPRSWWSGAPAEEARSMSVEFDS
jgi:hypothetical protein